MAKHLLNGVSTRDPDLARWLILKLFTRLTQLYRGIY